MLVLDEFYVFIWYGYLMVGEFFLVGKFFLVGEFLNDDKVI